MTDYRDGDSGGWVWSDGAHDSYSLTDDDTVFPESEPQPTYSLIVAGGPVEAENLVCSEAEWGGFDTCTFDVKTRPDWLESGLRAFGDVAVYFDGQSIFEGRIADVSKEIGDGCVRRVTCRGYFDVLKDDDTLRRTIVDTDVASWEDNQVDRNSSKFNVLIDPSDTGLMD